MLNSLRDRCLAAVALHRHEDGSDACIKDYDTHLDACLQDVFIKCGWNPMLGLVEVQGPAELFPDPDATVGQQFDRCDVVLNLWEIPDPTSLLQVMNTASDNATYVDMSANIMLRESQAMHAIQRYDPLYRSDQAAVPLNGKYYFKESLSLDRDPGKRHQLEWNMAWAKSGMNEKYGWEMAYAGNVLTGTINRYVHLWSIPQAPYSPELMEAIHYYRHGDGQWQKPYDEALATLPGSNAHIPMIADSFWTRRTGAFQNRVKFTSEE